MTESDLRAAALAATLIHMDEFADWLREQGLVLYGVRFRNRGPYPQWEAWAGEPRKKATLHGYGKTARAAMDALIPKARAALAAREDPTP